MKKKNIKEIFPQGIWDYLRYLRYKIFNNGYFAKHDLDKKMLKYLNYPNGYFIEIGANDGFTASNTLALENKKNWRGVLIEPCPNLFLSCCYFRSKKGNSIHCCACVPFDYKEKYVEIDYANLMSVSTSLPLDIKNLEEFKQSGKAHLNSFAKKLKFGAPAITLTNILNSNNSPTKIDFMSLDVEGSELAVLSGLDFNKYIIKYILVESRGIKKIENYLKKYNYKMIEKLSIHDFLFTKD
jgi:FkbM family methyltransferase